MHEVEICVVCGKTAKYYDSTLRIVRRKGGRAEWVKIKRFKCISCREVHRYLPDYILPYKQYEIEIIQGVIEGFITSDTIGFEDYPCETTMERWRTQNLQLLL